MIDSLARAIELLRGKKTYFVAAAGAAYLALCQFTDRAPSAEVLGILAFLGLGFLRAGVGRVAPLLALALVPWLAAGCLSHSHARYDPASGRLIERSRDAACLVRGQAANIRADTKDRDYSRSVRVGALSGETEADKLGAVVERAVTAAVRAAKP